VTALQMRLDGEEVREDSADQGKLTTEVDGHAHLLCLTDWDGSSKTSGVTASALSAGASEEHDHAWVKNQDGTITIAASSGHTHALVEERSPFLAPLAERWSRSHG
jgi:hypothetical protein